MPNLLLLSNHPDDEKFAAEVAQGTGLSLIAATDAKEAVSHLEREKIQAIFADVSTPEQYYSFEKEIENRVGLFSEKVQANSIHFISSEDIHKVEHIVRSPMFGNFIYRNYGDASAAGKHYGRILRACNADRAFGLQNLLPEGSKVQTVKFQHSGQKQEAVEAVKNYLLAAKFKARMANVVANAVDELLMNAMFDAPVDNIGNQMLAKTPRSTRLELKGPHEVEMQIGYDGRYIAITAVDLWGSLDKNKLMNHISKVYMNEEYRVKTSVAGAGIGLATVFRSGGSFLFTSENRVRTEVTVFFRRFDNYKEFREQFRFISTQFYF